MKELFKQIIIERQDWLRTISPNRREIGIEKNANYVFTGLRRAGKSFLLYQIIKDLVEDNDYKGILFINFEDERLLELTHKELHLILEAYYEIYDLEPTIFLDEIQNIKNWQKFVRRLADDGLRIYVTGSNAEMLSSEIATTLGGRFINKEVLPLSFSEFLQFRDINYSRETKYSKDRFVIINAWKEFLKFGGLPELLRLENKREFLSSVYQKLFYGDIISRNNISNVHVLKLLIKKLAESVNNETSVNRIKNLIKSTSINIGSNTLFDYISYLEASFMIASVSNYHSKFVERETNKKYYFLDTGILALFLHDQDTKLLENQVYIQLRRMGYEVYFLKKKTEIDFYVPDEELLIQVSYSINDPETYKREVDFLTKSMEYFGIKEGWIITYDERKTIPTPAGTIHVIPSWEWLLVGS